jgi:hypothetical protein
MIIAPHVDRVQVLPQQAFQNSRIRQASRIQRKRIRGWTFSSSAA